MSCCNSLISSTIRRQVVRKQNIPRIINSASQSTVSYQNDIPYEKPHNVEQWERLATKELSKSSKSVYSLRTERVTPVSIIYVSFCNTSSHLSIICMFFSYVPSTSYYRKG